MTPQFFSNEIVSCASIEINWSQIDNKTILITGASGLIGRYLIEVLLKRNLIFKTKTRIIAVGRNKDFFYKRFAGVANLKDVIFFEHDIQIPFDCQEKIDIIVHMASNTHPTLYATDPIGTVMTNIFGTYYLLELASKNAGCKFIFTSSGDVYGNNNSTKEFFSEHDCGYIDCNTLRAGYIEGKRASEALCNAFYESKSVPFIITRLCRIYGPTMNLSDSKAISQFIKNTIRNENIILKSEGTQTFSYLYVYDVVAALLTVISKGELGEAYNIADNNQVISLRNLAEILADISNTRIEYSLPDSVEKKGASTFQDVKLDGNKLKRLGWESKFNMIEGLKRTVEFLRLSNMTIDSPIALK